MSPSDSALQAWTLVSPPPGTSAHWLALRSGRASGGIARSPAFIEALLGETFSFSLHLGCNPTNSARFRPTSREITHLSTLFLDVDPIDDDAQPFRYAEELIRHAEVLLGTRLHPYLIDSGRGAQLWIPCVPTPLLDSPDRTRWRIHVGLFLRHLEKGTPRHWGCRLDTSTADLPRVGRLIGSINHRTGRLARQLTAGIRCDKIVPAIHTFASSASDDLVVHLSKGAGTVTPGRWQEAIDLIPHATARIFLTEGVSEPGRHSAAWHTARSLAELGVALEGALRAVRFGARLCSPRLSVAEADRAVRCAYDREVGWASKRVTASH